jgi:hypothetical protein
MLVSRCWQARWCVNKWQQDMFGCVEATMCGRGLQQLVGRVLHSGPCCLEPQVRCQNLPLQAAATQLTQHAALVVRCAASYADELRRAQQGALVL